MEIEKQNNFGRNFQPKSNYTKYTQTLYKYLVYTVKIILGNLVKRWWLDIEKGIN